MKNLARWIAPLALISSLSSAYATSCFFDECNDVAVLERHYDLGGSYYVSEPDSPDVFSDIQRYFVYRSGDLVGDSDPIVGITLENTHETCCSQNDLLSTPLSVGAKVIASVNGTGKSVAICAHKGNYYTASYDVSFGLKRVGSQLELSLAIPAGAPTCSESQGTFLPEAGVQDVRSVQLLLDVPKK